MLIVPRTLDELLLWGDTHSIEWESSFASIGLSPAQIAAFKDSLDAAKSARSTAEQLELARRSATLDCKTAVQNFRATAAETLASIKAFAEQQDNPDIVFSAAHLPIPQRPSPAPPPGKPEQFSFSILPTGAFVLQWKCANPYGTSGTIYQIERSIADNAFAILGHSGTKKFLDKSVPAGSSRLVYRVTAIRSTVQGPMAVFVVTLGVTADAHSRNRTLAA